jgi:hypothetical protein
MRDLESAHLYVPSAKRLGVRIRSCRRWFFFSYPAKSRESVLDLGDALRDHCYSRLPKICLIYFFIISNREGGFRRKEIVSYLNWYKSVFHVLPTWFTVCDSVMCIAGDKNLQLSPYIAFGQQKDPILTIGFIAWIRINRITHICALRIKSWRSPR